MDLTIFRQICDSENSLTELIILTILTNFKQNSSRRNQLGGFDDFKEFSPFWLLHAFLDSLLYAVCVFYFEL